MYTQNRPVRVCGNVGSHTGSEVSSVWMTTESKTRLTISLNKG
jgi:hypothetical protein